MNISFVGLGKLGLPLAACYAKRGHNVLGIDLRKDVVERVNNGEALWH
jgi:UDP-N-acetyl-D-mannosaminuronate dehydrogenase